MGYWLRVLPGPGTGDSEGEFHVEYSRGPGFIVSKTITEETARLLEIAREAGRNEHIAELRKAMTER